MKKTIALLGLTLTLFLSGCGNLSPRDSLNPKLEENINNQQGRIDRIENNQNSIRAEVDRLSLINKENNNNGIQIFQGEGGLFLLFGSVTIFLVVYYFYKIAEGERKTAELLAEQIIRHKDPHLEDKVLKAAEYTDIEEKINTLINKKKSNN